MLALLFLFNIGKCYCWNDVFFDGTNFFRLSNLMYKLYLCKKSIPQCIAFIHACCLAIKKHDIQENNLLYRLSNNEGSLGTVEAGRHLGAALRSMTTLRELE